MISMELFIFVVIILIKGIFLYRTELLKIDVVYEGLFNFMLWT